MKFLLFKTEKPKQYAYKPRYFDPEKEELEQRKKAMGMSTEQDHNERLRMRIQHEWDKRNKIRKRQRKNAIQLLVFIALATVLIYWIMK